MKSPQQETAPIQSYRDILAAFTEPELHLIARIKRFLECLSGDIKFRRMVETNPEHPDLRERLRKIGVEFAPGELRPLWSQEMKELAQYWQWLGNPLQLQNCPEPKEPDLDLQQWPLLSLWTTWLKNNHCLYDASYATTPLISTNARFAAWHQRRIASAKSELGTFGNQINHPIFAFELSRGCSVGCWFCGFSTKKLSAIFAYTPENRALWREIVQIGRELFGEAAGWAMCYYGTEPHDNPNYIDFLRDYRELTGSTLCTATAAPVEDPDWMRRLIAFYRETMQPWPRLSVLSVSMLHRLHETYTPDELRDVSFLMQMNNASSHMKAGAGRLLHADKKKLGGQQLPDDAPFIPQGSIACVSGFLVNMVDRTIQLISPCYANERWPYGYRVFAVETFDDADSYRNALYRLINQHMAECVTPDMRLALRDDLKFLQTAEGFTLISPTNKHHIKGKPFHGKFGELLAQGNHNYQEIMRNLSQQQEASVFDISRIVMNLFDRGILDEMQVGMSE